MIAAARITGDGPGGASILVGGAPGRPLKARAPQPAVPAQRNSRPQPSMRDGSAPASSGDFTDVVWGAVPNVGLMLLFTGVLIAFPALALWLPRTMVGP